MMATSASRAQVVGPCRETLQHLQLTVVPLEQVPKRSLEGDDVLHALARRSVLKHGNCGGHQTYSGSWANSIVPEAALRTGAPAGCC